MLSFLVTALFQGEVILGKVELFIQVCDFIYVLYVYTYTYTYRCMYVACIRTYRRLYVCLGMYGNVVHW